MLVMDLDYIHELIKQAEAAQAEFEENIQAFSDLDLILKARKAKGENLTNEDEQVQELMRLGKLVKWDIDPTHYRNEWLYNKGKIDAYKEILEQYKSRNMAKINDQEVLRLPRETNKLDVHLIPILLGGNLDLLEKHLSDPLTYEDHMSIEMMQEELERMLNQFRHIAFERGFKPLASDKLSYIIYLSK
jgi:hypothetical protein